MYVGTKIFIEIIANDYNYHDPVIYSLIRSPKLTSCFLSTIPTCSKYHVIFILDLYQTPCSETCMALVGVLATLIQSICDKCCCMKTTCVRTLF